MVKLGDEVTDKISGFTGIVVCRSEWLYNCVRIMVQPQKLHDGKPIDAVPFDEDQLEVVQAGKCGFVQKAVAALTGGDRNMRDVRKEEKR